MYAWMLIHCKNNAIHCKINDICIEWMLILCKNNSIHYKINELCIAWILIHCKNNAILGKFDNMCIAFILIHCKSNAIHYQIDDICTEAPGGAGGPHSLKNNGIHSKSIVFALPWCQFIKSNGIYVTLMFPALRIIFWC